MYTQFYGFKERPFSLSPDSDFLFLSDRHRRALELLELAVRNQSGFCVVSGEIGAGKTTLMRELLNRLNDDICVGLVSNTHHSFGELLQWIMAAYGLKSSTTDKFKLHSQFVEFLAQQHAEKRRTLLIVDEAQNLSIEALEELRMLSNVNSDKDFVLQIILLGQEQLRDKLKKPELEQFAQRVAFDYHLGGLDEDETGKYIHYRVTHAGGAPDLFSADACREIFRYSRGIPRLINRTCELSLLYGLVEKSPVINAALVNEVVSDQKEGDFLKTSRGTSIPLGAAALEVVGLAVGTDIRAREADRRTPASSEPPSADRVQRLETAGNRLHSEPAPTRIDKTAVADTAETPAVKAADTVEHNAEPEVAGASADPAGDQAADEQTEAASTEAAVGQAGTPATGTVEHNAEPEVAGASADPVGDQAADEQTEAAVEQAGTVEHQVPPAALSADAEVTNDDQAAVEASAAEPLGDVKREQETVFPETPAESAEAGDEQAKNDTVVSSTGSDADQDQTRFGESINGIPQEPTPVEILTGGVVDGGPSELHRLIVSSEQTGRQEGKRGVLRLLTIGVVTFAVALAWMSRDSWYTGPRLASLWDSTETEEPDARLSAETDSAPDAESDQATVAGSSPSPAVEPEVQQPAAVASKPARAVQPIAVGGQEAGQQAIDKVTAISEPQASPQQIESPEADAGTPGVVATTTKSSAVAEAPAPVSAADSPLQQAHTEATPRVEQGTTPTASQKVVLQPEAQEPLLQPEPNSGMKSVEADKQRTVQPRQAVEIAVIDVAAPDPLDPAQVTAKARPGEAAQQEAMLQDEAEQLARLQREAERLARLKLETERVEQLRVEAERRLAQERARRKALEQEVIREREENLREVRRAEAKAAWDQVGSQIEWADESSD